MPKRGKKYTESRNKVDSLAKYELKDGLKLVTELNYTKFDETVDVAIRLGVDPRHADQMVRGAVLFPHGIGKEVRVLVFAKGEKEREALEAGADFVGVEEFIDKIAKGWLEFDKAISTPDLMGMVAKLGKILGPRGMMPNPKSGTVTFDVARAVKETKAGKVDFRVEKAGIVHIPAGKASFGVDKLFDNVIALLETVTKLKPASSKGTYLRSLSISTTMGPGISIDVNQIRHLTK